MHETFPVVPAKHCNELKQHIACGAAHSESLKPNLVVGSGSTVIVEMITHHAGDDPDK
jgi:hypothetical protein